MASFGIIGLVLTCITTLIHLVGLSIPLWTKSGTVNYGLWKYCISGTCFDTVALKGWFKAFAFFSLGGAVVLGILRMIVFKDKKMIPAIAMAACFTAGLVLTCITTLIHLVGLSIPLWTKSRTMNYGLWKYCISGTCFDIVTWEGGNTPPYACAFIMMVVKHNIFAGFLTVTSLALHIIGIACPFWIKYGDSNVGLWKTCWRTKCDTVNPQSWLKAVQAFAILGLLALVAACLITFARFFVDKHKTVVSIIATVFNLAAAGAVLLAVIVFAAEINSHSFHISFVFEILSFFLSSGAAGIHVLDILKSRNTNDGSKEIFA